MTTRLLRLAPLALVVAALAACTVPVEPPVEPSTTTSTTGPIDYSGPPRGTRVPCTPTPVGATFPAGTTCRNMTVDGYTREFLVYVPQTVAANPTRPVALVLMFHGSSGNGQQFLNISGWREQADREGFVAAFPTGLEYFVIGDGVSRWNTKWNSFGLSQEVDLNKRLPGYPASSPWPANDVGFTDQLVDDVAGHLAIDRARVYASGFSNGGAFGARLASERPDRFAAVATSGAPAPVRRDPSGRAPAPMWQAVGSMDERIASNNGLALPLPMDPAVMYATPRLGDLLRFNGTLYAGVPEATSTSVTDTTTTLTWCAPGRPEHRFSMVEDMTHVYPRGYNATTNPSGIVAARVFWSFFRVHPMGSPACP